jgi:hypothetical protein
LTFRQDGSRGNAAAVLFLLVARQYAPALARRIFTANAFFDFPFRNLGAE